MLEQEKQHRLNPALVAGESPILAAGTLHGAFGGAGTSWVGGHPGFNAAITDTAAGNYTVNLPVNFATQLLCVHAQSMTARIRAQVVLAAGPVVGGYATTNVQVLCYNDAGVLANADVMLVVISGHTIGKKGSPIVAMGYVHEVGLAAHWGSALGHPGFLDAIANNGGAAGDYTVTISARSNAAQVNLVVTPMTADRHVMVIKTDVPGTGTTFRIVALDNAAAPAETELALTVVETMPDAGENPAIAIGALHEAAGGPGTWIDVAHPGWATLPVTRNAQGDYTLTMGADNTTAIVNVFATVVTAAAPDTVAVVTKPTATTINTLVRDSANGLLDADLELTAFII